MESEEAVEERYNNSIKQITSSFVTLLILFCSTALDVECQLAPTIQPPRKKRFFN